MGSFRFALAALAVLGLVVIVTTPMPETGETSTTVEATSSVGPTAVRSAPTRAAPPTTAPTTTTPPPLSGSRNNPVEHLKPLTVKEKGRTIFAAVIHAVRDDGTYARRLNAFNSRPRSGREYLLIYMLVEYFEGPDGETYLTPDGASVLFENRMWGRVFGVTGLEPKLGGVRLYPGGKADGWLDAMEIPKGASGIMLNWGQDILGGGGYWFQIPDESTM